MKADGYATALMVLGTEKAINLIKSEGLAAYLIFEEIEKFRKKKLKHLPPKNLIN